MNNTNVKKRPFLIENEITKLIDQHKCIRVLESHSFLSASVAANAVISNNHSTNEKYHALWSSSLTDSTVDGLPDIEILPLPNRIAKARDIANKVCLPLIIDADTGGHPEHFKIHVREMELSHLSAVIIEDKEGLKKNSLLGNDIFQIQSSAEDFCKKITAGVETRRQRDLLIIARIESLILQQGMDDALSRASAYLKAGADGIMIHSRQKTPDEILEFAARFRSKYPTEILVCVPTSFNEITFQDLKAAGFNIVIYANHMLRASYAAMLSVAQDILMYGRTKEIESKCVNVDTILKMIPGTI
ncbi:MULTISPECIES: phosphoenolpyruvate mutase [unclassified Bartonella]|uniref:phosphoenolpyruvate mutase n=1 Tax=unclassified Bartonella TaxID=2645622 RepID=UPI0035CEC35C